MQCTESKFTNTEMVRTWNKQTNNIAITYFKQTNDQYSLTYLCITVITQISQNATMYKLFTKFSVTAMTHEHDKHMTIA